ncbi:MAG: patatin-like phospholipase family protein [Clostridia bacterium]|nr:patatin-like phospholipase family protein [Clostridia bacterium]
MNIGVVLGGGFAKGAYHIGALKAIEERFPFENIKYLSCASIGALNGYAFAARKLDRAVDMWNDFCSERDSIFMTKLLRGDRLKDTISNLCTPAKELECPLYVSLFNWRDMSNSYVDISQSEEENIEKYLLASISLPVFRRSVEIKGNRYYDGGLVDNIPVYPLLEHDLDFIICIYFDDQLYTFESPEFDDKIVKITFPNETIIKQSMLVSKKSIQEMIGLGQTRTAAMLEEIFGTADGDLEKIYDSISKSNLTHKNKKLRLTTDIVITNLNKITQKLSKRKNIE